LKVVDSLVWMEYFADGPNAEFFAPAIEDTDNLVVPSLTIFKVFKKLLAQRSETEALQATRLSLECKLPLADSVILATARAAEAELWTQDADFEGLPGVKYIAR